MHVGIFMRRNVDLIGRGEVASQIPAQAARVEDVEMRVTIYTGRPFAAEKLPVGGIDVVFKGFNQAFQIALIKRNAFFNPEVNMIGFVLHHRGDTEVFIGIDVGDPELPPVTDLSRGSRDRFGNVGFALKPFSKFNRVVEGHYRFFKNAEGFPGTGRGRSGCHHGGRGGARRYGGGVSPFRRCVERRRFRRPVIDKIGGQDIAAFFIGPISYAKTGEQTTAQNKHNCNNGNQPFFTRIHHILQ